MKSRQAKSGELWLEHLGATVTVAATPYHYHDHCHHDCHRYNNDRDNSIKLLLAIVVMTTK